MKDTMLQFRRRIMAVRLIALTYVLLVGPAAWAQQESGIAGVVRDTSGAVLPGVTVEAASPALIEMVRTAVTDGEGRYNVVALRPGAYVVTFALAGFSTVKREGIQLTAGFTATVNADLRVGAVTETITVTGAAPLVDTQNVRQQQVISAEVLDVLPTGTKAVGTTFLTLTPGLIGAVGVSSASVGVYGSAGNLTSYHGKVGGKVLFDGMSILNTNAGDGAVSYIVAGANVEEMTLETGGASAESSVAGFASNVIPKEGSNQFTFSAVGMFTNDSLMSDNLTDELRARGLKTVNKVLNAYDATASLGGPIKTNRLWFFATSRYTGTNNQWAGSFWNKVQGTGFYEPDLNRPAYRKEQLWAHGARLTWQASARNKVGVFADTQHNVTGGSSSNLPNAAETIEGFEFWPMGLYQVTWSLPVTTRLLMEAGTSWHINHWPTFPLPHKDTQVSPTDISTLELSTNFRYNSAIRYRTINDTSRYAQRFSVSYITGSHALKVGMGAEEAPQTTKQIVYGDVNYTFLNGVPSSLTQWATPWVQKQTLLPDLGLYAQDRWTVKRLTVNYGLRFDYLHAYVPVQPLPATQFLAARTLDKVDCLPCWTDLNPRVGASYDLFGNGRTALKMSWGRYVGKTGTNIAQTANPINTSVSSVTRTWNDTNRNYVPDCDLKNFAANGECQTISDSNFGQNNPKATRYSEDVIHGFGVRDYLWDIAAEVQQQLRPGVSVSGGYYRNSRRNISVTDNLAVMAADYDPFCITAPVDAQLPNGGGYQVCGLYDIKPNRFGQSNNVVTQSSHFGKVTQAADFLNVSFNARFAAGLRFGGGFDTGRTVNDNCFVIDSPQQLLNCRVITPFKAQTQLKLNGSYPLPGDFVVSGTFQNASGPAIDTTYAVSNALIAPSLGRNLASCGTRVVCTATVTVPLISPQTEFDRPRTQIDLRLSKIFRVGSSARVQANFDAYNLLNANSVIGVVSAYGPRWQLPTQVLEGRLLQFSGQLNF